MRTHKYVSTDHVYQAREHYRCVVLTDYRVGRQERTEWLSAFVRSPSWFRFFHGNSKRALRGRGGGGEGKKRERTQQPNVIIVKTHQYNKPLCTSSTMRMQRERKRMNE
jgi:hypothetical protein